MSSRPPAELPWWQRRWASLASLITVIAIAAVAALGFGQQVTEVLGEVGKDHLGEDPWEDPVGVELNSGYEIGHVPDCAAAPVTRIVLWDAESTSYWEVAGPPTPIQTFFVGATPGGFEEVVPYEEPPPGEVLRLVVFRRTGGVAGLRYQRVDLRDERVMSGRPLRSFTRDGFQTASVCGDASVGPEDDFGVDMGLTETAPAETDGTTADTGTADTGTTDETDE